MFQNRFFGHHLKRVLHEHAEQPELCRRQRNAATGSFRFAQPHIERQIAEGQDVAARQSPAKSRANANEQFFQMEWLDQVIISASIKTGDSIRYGVTRRQHNDWYAMSGFQASAKRQSVNFGKHPVQQNQIRLIALRCFQCSPAIRRNGDAQPCIAQSRSEHRRQGFVIINEQDMRCSFHMPGIDIAIGWRLNLSYQTSCELALAEPAEANASRPASLIVQVRTDRSIKASYGRGPRRFGPPAQGGGPLNEQSRI